MLYFFSPMETIKGFQVLKLDNKLWRLCSIPESTRRMDSCSQWQHSLVQI